jgi:hypothetical protein
MMIGWFSPVLFLFVVVVRYAQACNKELECLDETLVASTKELYINAERGMTDYAEALSKIGESRRKMFNFDFI